MDDFALRRRHTYGTVMIDFETRKIIDMIPTRDQTQVTEWLKRYPNLKLISRDGSKAFKKAIERAHPNALQVTDRFHLLNTLIERAKQDLTKRLPSIIYESWETLQAPRKPLMKTEPNPRFEDKLAFIERVRFRYEEVKNVSLVAREFALSRDTVRKYVKEAWKPQEIRLRPSVLQPYKERMQIWVNRGESALSVHKKLSRLGLEVAYETVLHYIRKHLEPKKGLRLTCRIQRTQVLKLLYNKGLRDLGLNEHERDVLINSLNTHKEIQGIIDTVTNFRIILASKDTRKFYTWMNELRNTTYTYLKRFLDTVHHDYKAIINCVRLHESNGIAEGKINKIKRIKREMYGRCTFETLKQKIFLSEFST